MLDSSDFAVWEMKNIAHAKPEIFTEDWKVQRRNDGIKNRIWTIDYQTHFKIRDVRASYHGAFNHDIEI